MNTVLIVSLAAVVVGIALWFAIVRMRRVVGRGREAVAGLDRQATATSLGFASGGGRGHCTIGVDATRFVVALWSPPLTTEIRVTRIVAVEAARTREGRSGRDVLRVRFRAADGAEDAVDLVVADVPGWVDELRRRAKPRRAR
ncbi:hypothetical protein [Pseudonocardia sp.]|uniref:hypothetical protein n=1 Tax=Pseudonocardia sp. TaxID=60912 RepID=UPI003D0B42AC